MDVIEQISNNMYIGGGRSSAKRIAVNLNAGLAIMHSIVNDPKVTGSILRANTPGIWAGWAIATNRVCSVL